MGAQERSLKVYDSKRTFFSKLGTRFSKIFAPTHAGINNWLVNMKRSSMLKNYKSIDKAKSDKKEMCQKKFQETYSLYLESIDQLVIENIYKRVRTDTASDFERNALSKYYNVIHLKENDTEEYKYKKQQYLLNLDYNSLKSMDKKKTLEEYQEFYLYEMEQLYKSLLKHYSMKLSEKLSNMQKQEAYDKIFDTLEDYVSSIMPLKKVEDADLIKECSLFETYEVGKLDQVDIIDKRMILLGISRKIFTHSLPLVAAERCYIKLLKDARSLIVDTKIARKRENAYQLLLRLIEQYNDKLLAVKIYWKNNDEKKKYARFDEDRKALEALKTSDGNHAYEVKRQILFIRSDMKYLEESGDKYFRILKFYRNRLVNLGDMRRIKNAYSKEKGTYTAEKELRKVLENEAACWNSI